MQARVYDGCYFLLREYVSKIMAKNGVYVDESFLGESPTATTSERFLCSRRAHMLLAPHFNKWCDELFEDLPLDDDARYEAINKRFRSQKQELINRAISFFLNPVPELSMLELSPKRT